MPDHIDEDGVELFEACLERGLEGVVAKHKQSPYVPGQRSPFWLKVKAVKSDDFVVVGWMGEQPFDALVVGYHEDGPAAAVRDRRRRLGRRGHGRRSHDAAGRARERDVAARSAADHDQAGPLVPARSSW